MAEVRPFRAWRFNSRWVPRLTPATAPMADAVEPHVLESLYSLPRNAIHLTLPRDITESAAIWAGWQAQGVVLRDAFPTIYAYEQRFSLYGRTSPYRRLGFMALLNDDPSASCIRVHEDVLPDRVAHRVAEYDPLPLQALPTHGLYEDADFRVERILADYAPYPLAEVADPTGTQHTLWAITDRGIIARIQDVLRDLPVYLADGHHRWAAYQAYAQTHGANGHLMFFSNLLADDLLILPTHRVVELPAGFAWASFLAQLQNWFTVQELKGREPLYRVLERGRFAILLTDGQRAVGLTLRPGLAPESVVDLLLPEEVKRLDYTLLHALVLDKALGYPYAKQASNAAITYWKNAPTAVKRTVPGKKMAALMGSVPVAQFRAVCDAGARMPQKSTYFHPKALGGLVFADLAT